MELPVLGIAIGRGLMPVRQTLIGIGIQSVAVALLAGLLASGTVAAEPTVEDGTAAFLRAEFDRAEQIWKDLVAAGNTEAREGLAILAEMDHEARLRFINMGVGEAIKRQDLAEVERLWTEAEKLALTWPDEPPGRRAALQAKLKDDLAFVRSKRAELARVDGVIAVVEAELESQAGAENAICRSSLTRGSDGVTKWSGGCPEGTSPELAARHQADLEAARADFKVGDGPEFVVVETRTDGSRGVSLRQ